MKNTKSGGDYAEEFNDNNSCGSATDHFGNTISWTYNNNDGLVTIFIGKTEISTWYCEIDPIDCFYDFLEIWNLAQKSKPQQ